MVREHFSVQIVRCKLECLTPALTRFLLSLNWFSAAILSQQIWPVTWSKLKNCTFVVTKVWRATRHSSLPHYEPAFVDVSKNEPQRVCWLDLQTMIHPVLLTVLAFFLSYEPSVTPMKVPFIRAPLTHSMSVSPSLTSSHTHSPPSDCKSSQKETAKDLIGARLGPISLQSTCSFDSLRMFAGTLHAGT
jgi:hypothetical protein